MKYSSKLSPDQAAKNFLLQDSVYAKIVRVKCFNDKKDVMIERVTEMDPNAPQLRIDKEDELVLRETRRDLIKKVVINEKDGCSSMIVGLEPQTYNSPDMVFR
ncbi:hypothetical protein, partial [Ileibacterium valens]